MDPQFDKTPGLGLPQPSTEQGAAGLDNYKVGYIAPEAPPMAAEFPSGPSAGGPSAPPIMMPPNLMPPALQAQADPQALATSATATADDSTDALDEEWINKAKAIIERTKADPYEESRELSKAKADYLRIRYNKHVKIAEDSQQ